MKKILLLIILCTLPGVSYANIFVSTKVGTIQLEYISYEVKSDLYTLKVGISKDAVDLSELSRQYGGVSGINGVFFCPADYRQCNGKNYTINERFIDGKDQSFYKDTGERGVFGWNFEGIPFIYQTGKINPENRGEIYEGLGNFPIIYSNGVNILEHYHDVGLYDSKMKSPLPRHFICSNKDKTHILFGKTSATSLDNLAPALYELGCWDALNLDAGNSSHFNYNGKELVSGARNIIDGFIIKVEGLDTKKIEENISSVMTKVSAMYKKYPKETALRKLDIFLGYIPKLREQVYENYTSNIYNDQGGQIGYTSEITLLSDLQKVYTFNVLERKLKELYKEISD